MQFVRQGYAVFTYTLTNPTFFFSVVVWFVTVMFTPAISIQHHIIRRSVRNVHLWLHNHMLTLALEQTGIVGIIYLGPQPGLLAVGNTSMQQALECRMILI